MNNQKKILIIIFIVIILVVLSIIIYNVVKNQRKISQVTKEESKKDVLSNTYNFSTKPNTNLGITLAGTTTSPTPLTYYIKTVPDFGTLTDGNGNIIASSSLPYKLPNNFITYNSSNITTLSRTTSFTYYANDGNNDSNTGSINITINYMSQPPTTNNVNITDVMDNANKTITLSGSDPDTQITGFNENITYIITSRPNIGSLQGITADNTELAAGVNSVVFIPTIISSSQVTTSFNYKAKDKSGLLSNESTVTITISSSTTPPTLLSSQILSSTYSLSSTDNKSIDLRPLVNTTGDTTVTKDQLLYFYTTNTALSSIDTTWTRLGSYNMNINVPLQSTNTTTTYRLAVINMGKMCSNGSNYNPYTNKCYTTCPTGQTPTNLQSGYYTDTTVCGTSTTPVTNYIVASGGRIAYTNFSVSFTTPTLVSANLTNTFNQYTMDNILYPNVRDGPIQTVDITVSSTQNPISSNLLNYYITQLPTDGLIFDLTGNDTLLNPRLLVSTSSGYLPTSSTSFMNKESGVPYIRFLPNPLVTIATNATTYEDYWTSVYTCAQGQPYNFVLPIGATIVAATWGRYGRPKANILDITDRVRRSPGTDPRVGLTHPDTDSTVFKWVTIYYYTPTDRNVLSSSAKYCTGFTYNNNTIYSNEATVTFNITRQYLPPTVGNLALTTTATRPLYFNVSDSTTYADGYPMTVLNQCNKLGVTFGNYKQVTGKSDGYCVINTADQNICCSPTSTYNGQQVCLGDLTNLTTTTQLNDWKDKCLPDYNIGPVGLAWKSNSTTLNTAGTVNSIFSTSTSLTTYLTESAYGSWPNTEFRAILQYGTGTNARIIIGTPILNITSTADRNNTNLIRNTILVQLSGRLNTTEGQIILQARTVGTTNWTNVGTKTLTIQTDNIKNITASNGDTVYFVLFTPVGVPGEVLT